MPSAASASPAVILVVDDESCVLETIRLILTHAGYTVLAAPSPAEALAAATRPHARIDLLLTDVVMPRQSGTELASAVLRAQPSAQVLFMAGMPDTPEIRDGVLGRGFPFLAKPFLPSMLVATVERVLETSRERVCGAAT